MGDLLDAEQLRMTESLIAFDPTTLTLRRRENRTKTSAGGVSGGGEYADLPQPITVFFGAKVQDDLPLQTQDGEIVTSYYTLVGMPGIDIQERDRFVIRNIEYTVVSVHRHLDYEVKADVETYYGGHH